MAADGVDVGEVAEEILGLFAEDERWDQPAVLADLAVTEHPDGTLVSVSAARPLDGHPRDALDGVRADSTVDGVALVFEAWATAGGHTMPWAPSQAADRIEVRSCLVVLRDGRHAAAAHERNGGTRRRDEAGPLLDTLLRMLGAATPPPAGNAGALLALHAWLNIVADHAEQAHRQLTWAEAVDVMAPAEAAGEANPASATAADIAELLRKLGDAMPPAAVYAIASAHASAQDPDVGWHDVGSFTRAVTAAAFSTYSDALDDHARREAIAVWQDLHTAA